MYRACPQVPSWVVIVMVVYYINTNRFYSPPIHLRMHLYCLKFNAFVAVLQCTAHSFDSATVAVAAAVNSIAVKRKVAGNENRYTLHALFYSTLISSIHICLIEFAHFIIATALDDAHVSCHGAGM